MNQSASRIARISYALCLIVIGVQQFQYGEMRPVIMVWPSALAGSPVFSWLTGACLVLAGTLLTIGKAVRTTALITGIAFFIFFLIFQCGFVLWGQPNSASHLGLWTNPLKELALAGGAWLIAAGLEPQVKWLLLRRIGIFFFCFTMASFGVDHFFYTEFVAGLVPAWMPDHVFWTLLAGVALIASGVAIPVEVQPRRVALLLSLMLILWVIVLHIPRAVAQPALDKGNEITSVFEAIGFSGIALGIALSYPPAAKDVRPGV